MRQAVDIEVRKQRDEARSSVRLLGVCLGEGEAAFRRLERRLAGIVATGGGWTGRIDASGEVPHRDVVRCLDAVQSAGIDFVTFTGRPPPRSGR